MKIKVFLVVFLLLIVAFGVILYRRNNIGRSTSSGPKVVVSIFPLYDIVKNVAGDEVETQLILPPGASPHTFDYTPTQVKEALSADAMFVVGHSIDNWAKGLATAAEITNVIVVDKNVNLLPLEFVDPDGVSADNLDPHYWLSIKNAEGMANQIKDELSALYPDKASKFEANYSKYSAELQATDIQIAGEFKNRQGIRIATFHNAYSYFAKDYGINIVASFEEFPGKEPTPKYLQEFEEQVRSSGTRVIFVEPQFATSSLQPIAEDLGVNLLVLDPLGGVPGRNTYLNLMQFNAHQVLENTTD